MGMWNTEQGRSGCGKQERGREEAEGEAEGAALMPAGALPGVSRLRQHSQK